MSKNKVDKIKVKFILEHLDDLRDRLNEDDTLQAVVDQIELLTFRSVPRPATGGGRNERGSKLRYRCPVCGEVLACPSYNNNYVGDYICRNCRQVILWHGQFLEDMEDRDEE